MKNLFSLLIATLFFSHSIKAQTEPGNEGHTGIPEQATKSLTDFTAYLSTLTGTDSARVRTIYDWIAHNVRYDVQRLEGIKTGANTPPQAVADVLKTRRAVCQGYADLFVALCRGVGLEARVVPGYAKIGSVISPVAHAWTAAKLDGQWTLFDPTWGAGYLQDNRFVKAYNPRFFMVRPEEGIRDHMPFDPAFQFLSYPLNNREFIAGAAKGERAEAFHFKDSIAALDKMTDAQKWVSELRRLEGAGIHHDLLAQRQRFLKAAIQSNFSKASVDEGGEAYGRALKLYKEYVGHKNKQFTAIEDKNLRSLLEEVLTNVRAARTSLLQAVPKTAEQREAVQSNAKNIEAFRQMTEKEKEFVERYIATDKAQRLRLFMQSSK